MGTDSVRTLCTHKGKSSARLRRALAEAARRIVTMRAKRGALEALLISRLVALVKNSNGDLRPIGIGEAWRRLLLKTIGTALRDEVTETAGLKQLAAGQSAACEAAIHWMRSQLEAAEMCLFVDASNAFNAAKRLKMLEAVDDFTPTLGRVSRNVYHHGSDLVLADGTRIRSEEGATQGCPIAMQCYAIGTLPLIEESQTEGMDQGWYADDSAGIGLVTGVANWFGRLLLKGPSRGYHVNARKTVALVRRSKLAEYHRVFSELYPNEHSRLRVAVLEDIDAMVMNGDSLPDELGTRYLGGGLGGPGFRRQYVSERVRPWVQDVHGLAEVAKVDPQVAHSLLTQIIVPRWRFLMRSGMVSRT